MSCDKIDPAKVSLNGASEAYGGSISNLTLNFGLLSSGTNARVTLVGESMSNPATGDTFTVRIMGLSLKMKVSGYTISSSATGGTTLTLNLQDKSHEILDNNFIVRNELVPKGMKGPIKYLGKKYGTIPNNVAVDYGTLIPSSDTGWGDLRAYFEGVQKQYNKFRTWQSNPMTDEMVDAHVRAANGKTLWKAKDLKKILVEDKVLAEDADFPVSGEFQLDGSYREVIMGVANTLGLVAYWDCETNKLVLANNISSSAGSSALDALSEKCELVGVSAGSDFTTSLSVGAFGSWTSSSSNTQEQKSQGGKMAKFYRGTPLNPTFHYSKCSQNLEEDIKEKDLFVIDVNNEDMQKAFYASWDSEFYAMYVLQTILRAKGDRQNDEIAPANDVVIMQGRNNFIDQQQGVIKESIKIDPCISYSINGVLKNRYFDITSEDDDCSQGVWGIYFEVGSDPEKNLNVLARKWNKNINNTPFKEAGEFKKNIFNDGYHIIREKGSLGFSKILNNSGLDGTVDPFRLYLNAIYRFYNIFHIIKENTGFRSIVDVNDKFYDYYTTQDAQGPGLSITAPNGFEHKTLNPYLSIAECGISEFVDLFVACSFMYTGSCDQSTLDETAVVDWIKVIERNQFKRFFKNPSRYQKARAGPFTQEQLSRNNSSQPQIHLFVQPSREDPNIGGQIGQQICPTKDVQVQEPIWKKIGQLSLTSNESEFFKEFEKKYQSFAITDEDIDGQASPISPAKKRSSLGQVWLDVDGSMGTLTTGPGPQYIGAAKMPSGGTWKSKFNRGISIDAADIGQGPPANGGNMYAANPRTEAKSYSDGRISYMKAVLEQKVAAHAWTDNSAAASRTVSVVLGDNFGDIKLPGIEDGLEALSITNSNGKLEISITVGNRFERESKRAMFELMAAVPGLQQVAVPNIPDTFIGGASPKLVQISKGMYK